MNPQIPRLHMGCGESLRSHWLLNIAQPERKPSDAAGVLNMSGTPNGAKRKRERTRG